MVIEKLNIAEMVPSGIPCTHIICTSYTSLKGPKCPFVGPMDGYPRMINFVENGSPTHIRRISINGCLLMYIVRASLGRFSVLCDVAWT